MQNMMHELSKICASIVNKDFVLMLDFDGVLAPIVDEPNNAQMLPATHELLTQIARRHRVAIVSGRSLEDIRRRVNLPGAWYAGNHGAEWSLGRDSGTYLATLAETQAFQLVRHTLHDLSKQFRGAYFEDKAVTASLHFRRVPIHRRKLLFAKMRILAKENAKTLAIERDFELVYTIRPRNAPNKDSAAIRILENLTSGIIPIFIGDDVGDEAAFRALTHGITIRVGKKRTTSAQYRIPSQKLVNTFLSLLA
jgi:trehalose-phosphatase